MNPSVEVKHATSAILKTMENAEERGWKRKERNFHHPRCDKKGIQVDVYEKGGKRKIVRIIFRQPGERREGKLDFIVGPDEFLEGLGDL